MLLVLGIDPGLNNTGWGLVSYVNNTFSYVTGGTIKNKESFETGLKLKNIYNELISITEKENPTECAIEDTFVNKNPRVSLKLGYAKGVALLAATKSNLRVFEYAPREIKSAVAGTGTATKEQMLRMLKYLLPLHKASSEHEADALAIAICHINISSFKRKLESYS